MLMTLPPCHRVASDLEGLHVRFQIAGHGRRLDPDLGPFPHGDGRLGVVGHRCPRPEHAGERFGEGVNVLEQDEGVVRADGLVPGAPLPLLRRAGLLLAAVDEGADGIDEGLVGVGVGRFVIA